MDLIPERIVRDLVTAARLYGLWRGALIGLVIGLPAGAALAVVILRGVLS